MLAQLHRVWRHLPPRLRRELYLAATAIVASPARHSANMPARPGPPYLVVGPLSAPTGLGEASRLVLHGLLAAGREVAAIDLSAALMQPAVVPLPAGLAPPRPGPGTLVLTAQPPNVAHVLALVGRPLLRDKRRLGFWAWEVNALPREWRQSRRLIHELAAPSRYAAALLSAGLHMPVRCAPFPLASRPRAPMARRAAGGEVVFGCAFDLGSTAARKNPAAVIAAFRAAFPQGGARLLVRVRDPGSETATFARLQAACEGGPAPITLLGRVDGAADIEDWFAAIDVLISLHRAEGFGLLPAEAMQRGIPVIATDWSATAEYVSDAVGWPVAARLVPAVDPTGRYSLPGATWAEVDIDAAAMAMRQAAGDAALRRGKGSAAAAYIATHFDAAQFIARLEAPA